MKYIIKIPIGKPNSYRYFYVLPLHNITDYNYTKNNLLKNKH